MDRPCVPRFAVIVRHDDAEREFAYDRKSHIGKLDEGSQRGWSFISMKNNWTTIYP